MNRIITGILTFLLLCVFSTSISAQEKSGYTFKNEKRLPASPVKDQYRSGTCWSFASISFVESELLRSGKGLYDLSEMYLVNVSYREKGEKYVRLHGSLNFGPGGLMSDMLYTWKNYGLVPDEAYTGLAIGEDKHIHGEMDEVLKDYVDGVVKNENRKLTPVWEKAYDNIIDTYLGTYPAEFNYEGKLYTPKSFANELGLNPEDYVMITSFTHHPFGEKFALEVPDNWRWAEMYNLPMDEMIEIVDNALEKGYTVAWDVDVSEKGFDWNNGLATVPSEETVFLSNLEQSRWQELSRPKKEKVITQEMRQEAFDNYTTTDDHLMHIIGKAEDQDGNPFYIVKNSGGTTGHVYNGYLYASRPYLQYKTLIVMVHKDALPRDIAKALKIK